MAPLVEVSVGLGVLQSWVLPRPVDTADFMCEIDLSIAKLLLSPFDPDLVEICVVHVVLADESSENIGSNVLQHVELVTC